MKNLWEEEGAMVALVTGTHLVEKES